MKNEFKYKKIKILLEGLRKLIINKRKSKYTKENLIKYENGWSKFISALPKPLKR